MKFAASIAVYLLTLAIIVERLSPSASRSYSVLIVLLMLVKIIPITIQAVRVRPSQSVGQTESAVIPFLRWNRHSGDLRVAHFIGIHGLQFMMAVGYLISIWFGDSGHQTYGFAALRTLFVI